MHLIVTSTPLPTQNQQTLVLSNHPFGTVTFVSLGWDLIPCMKACAIFRQYRSIWDTPSIIHSIRAVLCALQNENWQFEAGRKLCKKDQIRLYRVGFYWSNKAQTSWKKGTAKCVVHGAAQFLLCGPYVYTMLIAIDWLVIPCIWKHKYFLLTTFL